MQEQLSMFDILLEDYKITNPIRLIEFFSGIGAQAKALKNLGANFTHWHTCEWAYPSILAYNEIHHNELDGYGKDFSNGMSKEEIIKYLFKKGVSANYNEPMKLEQIKRLSEDKLRQIYNAIINTHDLVNIQQVKGRDLQIKETDKYCYILTYSFPCFTADSLVLTKNGYKKIENICVGDEVLSHDNKYHKVVNRFENGIHDIYKINAMGVDEIKTTYNHKFYVREKYRRGHKSIRCFKEPIWKELKDLTKNDYLGIAINQTNRSIVSSKLPMQNDDFWWVIGRYLGDGWIRQQGGIVICCAKDETYEITSKLKKLNWNYNVVYEKSVNKIHISKKALSNFVEQFGKGAGCKHLTQDILDLSVWYLKPFIEGYLSADGCFTNGVYKATSISRELIYGIAQCVAKVYKTPYRIYRIEPPRTKIIENRLVNQNNWYQLVFKIEKKKQDKAFYENGYIWYPIKSIDCIGKDFVYDIEVENSHSFTVQNTIVHNCQDLSLAGKQAGMSRNAGTRSGMLWEVERILDECNDLGALPQVLLMENVPQVIGLNAIKDFQSWRDKLESLGYSNYIEVLNAKDYGIPQNRERAFMVSILGEYNYRFPSKIKLEKRLKDILEENVDEKYFLSDKQLGQIIHWNAQQEPLETLGKDCSPTLTTRSGAYAAGMVLTSNLEDKGEEKKVGQELIAIKNATKQGYLLAEDGDGIDISGTLLASGNHNGVVINEPKVINPLAGKTPYGWHFEQEVYDENGIARAVKAGGGSGNIPKVIGGIGEKKSNGGTQWYQQDRIYDDNVAISITTSFNPYYKSGLRIRKLTGKECYRLMGFSDEDCDNARKVLSEAMIYHVSGDSICVNVLMAIFGQFFENKRWEEIWKQCIKENISKEEI